MEDVVALTRFGEPSGDIGNEPVLIQRLLGPIVTAERARWPGVAFELHVAPALPTVVADPTYVEQVVRNLLSNAAKYGGAGRVEVRADHDGDEVLVRVLDEGPGFPEAEADRLFELFFRSSTTAARASGAGIGLFVASRLAKAMGGRIWARRRDGGGAEFGFALRVMAEE
ncbi:MAG: sensor histidine kinase [Chloroflexota bacterium]